MSDKSACWCEGTPYEGGCGCPCHLSKPATFEEFKATDEYAKVVAIALENLPRALEAVWDTATFAATAAYEEKVREVEREMERRQRQIKFTTLSATPLEVAWDVWEEAILLVRERLL